MHKLPIIKQLEEELKKVERELRIELPKEIRKAAAHGDLRENAEYHAAKEQQGFIEKRIRELESKLSRCRVIDVSKIENNGKVVFGTTVTLLNIDTNEEVVYQIVGEDEADLKQDKISVTSPVARAMIGHVQGDEVIVQSPSGEIVYEVIAVAYC